MNTILVWILVSVGGHSGNQITYSPQFTDLASCEAVQNSANKSLRHNGYRHDASAQCVQVKVVK
jgi:hypothetical protein